LRLAGGAGPAEACRSVIQFKGGSWCGTPRRWRGATVSPREDAAGPRSRGLPGEVKLSAASEALMELSSST